MQVIELDPAASTMWTNSIMMACILRSQNRMPSRAHKLTTATAKQMRGIADKVCSSNRLRIGNQWANCIREREEEKRTKDRRSYLHMEASGQQVLTHIFNQI